MKREVKMKKPNDIEDDTLRARLYEWAAESRMNDSISYIRRLVEGIVASVKKAGR